LNKISILTLIFSLSQKKISKFEGKNNENTKIDESETKEVESLIPRTLVTGSLWFFKLVQQWNLYVI